MKQKSIDVMLIIVLMFSTMVIVGICAYDFGKSNAIMEQVILERHIENGNAIKFIWNDDEESIPKDGSNIIIEYTDGKDIYIGPLN